MSDMKRWRGLKDLVRDAVVEGSAAIERLQTETAARPFAIFERVPGVAKPAHVVHVVHDAAVAGTHVSIRAVTRVVSRGLDVALDALERE
ncbi:MAG: hypothetical protein JST54_11420 [Deltaproteobacteria bacterium]|nr:hypothetical protein [Deltaproteobacteria bacterium]